MLDPLTARLFHNAGHHGPLVLMYHAISEAGQHTDSPWSVPLDSFMAQLDLLQEENWHIVTIHDLGNMTNLPSRTVAITFDDGYMNTWPAYEALLDRGLRASWFIVANSIGGMPSWHDADAQASELLDAVALREMVSAGMEIGSHGLSHRRLTELDEQSLASELLDSRLALGELLEREVTSLAYPYGAFGLREVAAAKTAGYRLACTTQPGYALADGDNLRIRRLTIWHNDDIGTFARKLAFADNVATWRRTVNYMFGRIRSRVAKR